VSSYWIFSNIRIRIVISWAWCLTFLVSISFTSHSITWSTFFGWNIIVTRTWFVITINKVISFSLTEFHFRSSISCQEILSIVLTWSRWVYFILFKSWCFTSHSWVFLRFLLTHETIIIMILARSWYIIDVSSLWSTFNSDFRATSSNLFNIIIIIRTWSRTKISISNTFLTFWETISRIFWFINVCFRLIGSWSWWCYSGLWVWVIT